jgi:hypothetical protein
VKRCLGSVCHDLTALLVDLHYPISVARHDDVGRRKIAPMKTLCISSSMRFKADIEKAVQEFQTLGITALFPNLEVTETPTDVKAQQRLFAEHFAAVDAAGLLYVINKGGYIGNSVKIEIGYALGKGRPVIFSDVAAELELNALATAIIPLEHKEKLNGYLLSSLVE